MKATTVLASLLACSTFNALAVTLPPEPVARDDLFELTGLTLSISAPGILANDSGTGVIVSSFFDPGSGTLNNVITNGAFVYTPERGFAGTTTFDYFILDEYNRSSSATVTIDASTTLPQARDDYYTLSSLTLDVSAPGLLANDRGGIGEVIVSSFFNPSSGTLDSVITNGSFRYLADPGFTGLATFQYFSIDELGRSSSALVNINVVAVPEPGTWAMMLAGLAAVGYAGRRRAAT